VLVQLFHLGVNGFQRGIGFGAFAQQHDAFDDVVVVDDLAVLAVNRLADAAQPDLGPLHDRGDISNVNGRAVLSLEDGLSDVLDVVEEPDSSAR
jgi:hypothetical protein